MVTHSVHPFSHSLSNIEKSWRDVNQRSCVEKPMTRNHNKTKSSRDSGSAQGSQTEREKILFEQRDLHNSFERKADQAFQGECAAQTKLPEAQSELDRREWKMSNADRALCENGILVPNPADGTLSSESIDRSNTKGEELVFQ